MEHDLVVFVPGIGGSRLTRDGVDLWNMSLQAMMSLRNPRRALEGLALEPGMEDGHPEGRDAVEVAGLVREPFVLSGLMRHLGYLRMPQVEEHAKPGQYREFAYDWRLSNRTTAEDLQKWTERALGQWQEQARTWYPDMPDDPKVVFLCHSMGGLVTRYYLECLGGREITRSLTTIGTPHRGAAKAARFLTGHAFGTRHPLRWFGENITELCRRLPSVWQLLPVYEAVIKPGEPDRRTLLEEPLGLDSHRLRYAFRFHEQFEEAAAANLTAEGRPYRVHCLAGNAHRTWHGVVARPEGPRYVKELDNSGAWRGDGTVPAGSAVADWHMTSSSDAVWYGHKHASLHGEKPVGRQLAQIFLDKPVRGMLADEEEFGFEAPDLASADTPFEVVVDRCESRRHVVARLRGNGVDLPWTELTPDGAGRRRGSLSAPAGVWTLEVRADNPDTVRRDAVLVIDE
ncbi:hypothetical protein AB0L35_32750 [Streptomyces sp. NPDC052309]|uniref:esterase/lipase family protein n=1 Tax=Streptomyces sp. NPDC052309 TaxID=3155421 RepID=UPI003447B7A4